MLAGIGRFRALLANRLLASLEEKDHSRTRVDDLLWTLVSAVYFCKRLGQHLLSGHAFAGLNAFRFWKREVDSQFLMKLVAWSSSSASPHLAYQQYTANNRLTADEIKSMRRSARQLAFRPLISILVPVYNSEPAWLQRLVKSVRAQTYDRWELILVDDASPSSETQSCLAALAELDERIVWDRLPHNQGISAATNHAAHLANGEFFAFVDHDDELLPDALWWIADHLQNDPAVDLLYSDEEYAPVGDEHRYPYFKPGFSPELLTAFNYMCHLLVVSRRIFEDVGGLRPEADGAQDHDLILRIIERSDRIVHIPRILYRWHLVPQSVSREPDPETNECKQADRIRGVMRRVVQEHLDRTGLDADAEVVRQWVLPRFRATDRGKVSIVVCTKDHPIYLWRAVRSIEKMTRYPNYEIVIVDNESQTWLGQWVLKRLAAKHRVLRIPNGPGGFNYSYLNNQAARQVDGDYLLFLNDDTRVTKPGWLCAMVGYATRQDVGVVGARLLFPNRTVQHAGLILGAMGWGPWHALRGCNADSDGAFGYMTFPHNCIAVTGACLLTKRELFWRMGGFDEKRFAVSFNDVDYCLRLFLAGYRAVVATQAELIHYESVSRAKVLDAAEAAALARRYRGLTDPFWNRNYSRTCSHFSVSSLRHPRATPRESLPKVLWVGAKARPGDATPGWQFLADQMHAREFATTMRHVLNERSPLDEGDLQAADVVVAHGVEAVTAVEQANRLNIPCIWHLPQRLVLPPRATREQRRQFARVLAALRLPYRVVFNNLFSLQWAQAIGHAPSFSCLEHVFVQPDDRDDPATRDELRAQMGLSESDTLVVGAAQVRRPEEIEYLLAVCTKSIKQSPNVRFALLLEGEGQHRFAAMLRRQVRKLKGAVQILLNPSRSDAEQVLRSADLFLQHSLVDPRSQRTLEAMQAGLALLGPRDVVQADLLHPKANGMMLPRFRVARAVRAVLDLAAEESLRKSYGANSRNWLRSRSSIQDVLAGWEMMIRGAAELRERTSGPGHPTGQAKSERDAKVPTAFAFDLESRIA